MSHPSSICSIMNRHRNTQWLQPLDTAEQVLAFVRTCVLVFYWMYKAIKEDQQIRLIAVNKFCKAGLLQQLYK